MRRDRCLSCLSVTLVYCGEMAGRIKMSLGAEVDLGPGDIVLDGDPALPMARGTAAFPHFLATWPNSRPSQQLLSSCQNSFTVNVSGSFVTTSRKKRKCFVTCDDQGLLLHRVERSYLPRYNTIQYNIRLLMTIDRTQLARYGRGHKPVYCTRVAAIVSAATKVDSLDARRLQLHYPLTGSLFDYFSSEDDFAMVCHRRRPPGKTNVVCAERRAAIRQLQQHQLLSLYVIHFMTYTVSQNNDTRNCGRNSNKH